MWRAWLAGRAGSQGRGHAIARRRPSWVSLGPQADYVSAGDAIVPPLTSVLGHARVLPTARAVPSRFRAPQSFSWTGAEMSNPPIYEMLAQAFAREGVDTLFSLMGDGNMHWATAMSKIAGMRVFHVRHEHCACGMAMGYHSATGKVGVATVTCGPGVTQIATGADHGNPCRRADGGVRRRKPDQRPMVQSGVRPSPFGDGDRGALHSGAQHGTHVRFGARGLLRCAPRTQARGARGSL